MTLYYVRHGETVWNRAQRLQGRQDSPLTLRGIRLAIAYGACLAEVLDGSRDVEIVTSPMGRARQTAAIIADVLGLDPHDAVVDERIAEHDVGAWAGRTWLEIAEEHGRGAAELRGWHVRPPGGETRDEMLARARAWLASPRTRDATIVVSHGGFSRMLRGAYLGLTPDEMAEIPVHTHGRFYRLAEGRCAEVVAEDAAPPPEHLLG